HDLDRNSRPPASRDLLAGAAENHWVAAFEAHDAPARFGERYHQGVDLILLARRLKSGLADKHLPCLAAREIEDGGSDQVIDQDHVRRLQCPHGAQREQFRIAWARTDEGDRALLDRSAFLTRCSEEMTEVGFCRLGARMSGGVRRENLPEAAPAC